MNSLTQDYPAILRENHEAPCLSLYQPTHRQHPDNLQDPIRFRNLVKRLEEALRQRYASRDIPVLLRPFDALAQDMAFWDHTGDGLAVLAASGLFRVYTLQRSVAELAIVADSFHTKPLMRIAQSADRYHILGLNKREFKVYEGNRDALAEMPPIESVPQTSAEWLRRSADEREGAHRVYGLVGSSSATAHGTNVKQDAEDRDTEHFFRAVDRAVSNDSRIPSGQPLILAALPQHHHLFRAVSGNPDLIDEAIDVYSDALAIGALRERAWQLMQPHYLERLTGFVEAFGAANSSGRGSDDLGRVAEAAVAGRVETLLIEADRQIPGRIDAASGQVAAGVLDSPWVDDLLDDLGELVLKSGGEVIIVPGERMPTGTGAAAIYRY